MRTNYELVDYLVNVRRVLKSPLIIEAFKNIDRADFIRDEHIHEAYEDYPLPIGEGQTISQPYTVAFMLELLQPKENSTILDVGCGSCYTTALLATVAKKGKVIGVEIKKNLVDYCKANLSKYNFNNIEIHHSDKIPEDNHYQFDRILVSASAEKLPEVLINAMKNNSKMVIPVKSSIFLIEKVNGQLRSNEFYGFAFVSLK